MSGQQFGEGTSDSRGQCVHRVNYTYLGKWEKIFFCRKHISDVYSYWKPYLLLYLAAQSDNLQFKPQIFYLLPKYTLKP